MPSKPSSSSPSETLPHPLKRAKHKMKGKVKGKSAPNFVHIPLPSGPE